MTTFVWTVGQKVFEAAPRSHWGGFPGRALTIDRVTPSGRAVIGLAQYDPSGRQIGARGYNSNHIVPFTDEHEAEIVLFRRRMLAQDLADKIKWRALDAEQLDIAIPALEALWPAKEG